MSFSYSALYRDLLEDLAEFGAMDLRGQSQTAVQALSPDSFLTVKQFAALRLAQCLLKKNQDNIDADADQRALDKFLACDVRARDWSLEVQNLRDDMLVGLFREEMRRFFSINAPGGPAYPISSELILNEARTGPGASIEAKGTDFYTKFFSSPLSTTSRGLYRAMRIYYESAPTWDEAFQLQFAQFGEPVVVRGNRLSFVPKTATISRTIGTEPSLNMFFQLGIGTLLAKRLRQYFGIDLATQPDINRELARVGSLSGSLATIDLESASDSVSTALVREFVHPEWFGWMDLARSKYTQLPDGSELQLGMFSSMGNGFTFPLQTVIFCCVVSAAYQLYDLRRVDSVHVPTQVMDRSSVIMRAGETRLGNWGVFGDDIIVETQTYDAVVRLLGILGFRINADKSFYKGPFRESCGGDYFRGHQVRGVYLKTLSTQASRYVAINRLNRWSAITGIPLPRTVRRILKGVQFLPVPLYENDDAGVKVPLIHVRRVKRAGHAGGRFVYRRWANEPLRLTLGDGDIVTPRGAAPRVWNPGGVLLAILRGDVDSGSISIRLGADRYRAKEGVTLNWDWLPTIGADAPVNKGGLITAILRNLA